MAKRATSIALLAVLAAALSGCGPPFPKDLLTQVDRQVSFRDLQAGTEGVQGRMVMMGGVIIEARNLKEGTQIEVLQRPLDGQGRPQRTDENGGRFLVLSPEFHDTAVFHPGRQVTVIGTAEGQQAGLLGEIEYRYPVIRAREVHLWPLSTGPRFSFGLGVYKGL